MNKKSQSKAFIAISSFFIICLILTGAVAAKKNDNNLDFKKLFEEGNNFYQGEKYSMAVKSYEEILKYGLINPVIYYNLGNAYFKEGILGKSLLNYYRALNIWPRDKEIRHNLSFAQSKLIDKDPKIGRFLNKFLFYLNLNELFLSVFTSYFLTVLLIMLYNAKRKEVILWILIISSFLLITSGAWFGVSLWSQHIENPAVVIKSEVPVKSGPGDDYKVTFKLHEGTRLNILKKVNDWCEVEVFDSLRGWLRGETIERI